MADGCDLGEVTETLELKPSVEWDRDLGEINKKG